MLALSDLISFLLELMRDPATAAEFENDPEGVLAERGLDGVTAQDVRDARLELCDAGGATATGDAAPPSGDDPVREINHTASNYSAAPHAQVAAAHEQSALALQGPVTIDDRDTFIFRNDFSDDDTTIVNDSFNSVDNTDNSVVNNDVTAINDSFNDNSVDAVVDNSVDNSVVENDVLAINAENSFNGESFPVEPDGGTGAAPPDGESFPVEPDGGTGAAPQDGAPDDSDAFTSEVVEEEPDSSDAFTSEVVEDAPEEPVDEPVDEIDAEIDAADEAFDPVA